jgi:hypothetical protein
VSPVINRERSRSYFSTPVRAFICYLLLFTGLCSAIMRLKLCMRVFFSLLIAASLLGCAHQPQWKCAGVTSPDQKLRACVSSVGKHGPPFNESRIEIHDVSDHVLAFKDFRSPDGEHGRNVQKNEWTPDSQFYVFSTASSGGHSPWHWQTYFYDRRTNTFKEVDDFTGPIIKRDFTLSAPDWIEVTVQGTKSDPTDIVTGHKVKRQLSALH